MRNRNNDYCGLLKIFLGCEICGRNFPDLSDLEFHHFVPAAGTTRVSLLANQKVSLTVLKKEISLCRVACKPCHDEVGNQARELTKQKMLSSGLANTTVNSANDGVIKRFYLGLPFEDRYQISSSAWFKAVEAASGI
jgi:5-methylcytosine-specific restriction endonuclease McrA